MTTNWEWTSLFYLFTVMFGFAFWSILDGQYTVESGILVNLLVPCIFSCIDSGIFWTGIFEMPEEYIMVEHAVDRSLSGEQTWCRYVRWEVC